MVCTPRQPGAGANHSHTHGEGAKPLRSFPIFAHSKARVATLNAKAKERLCLMDARIRTLMAEPEEGAATAEYAVVLVAATGFAAVLVAILKSDAIKTLLTNIIKQALKVG